MKFKSTRHNRTMKPSETIRHKQNSTKLLSQGLESATKEEKSLYSLSQKFSIPNTILRDHTEIGSYAEKNNFQEDTKVPQKTLCCACLDDSDSLFSGLDETFQTLIGDVSVDFPLKFCSYCFNKLESFKGFKEKCLNSIGFLRKSKVFEMIEVKEEEHPVEVKIEKCEDDEKIEFSSDNLPRFFEKKKVKKPHKQGHKEGKTSKGLIYCGICKKHFKNILLHHIFDCHIRDFGNDNYHCLVCDSILESKTLAAIRQHFNSHNTTENPISCQTCGKTFNQRKMYVLHLQKHQKYECHHCHRKLSTRFRVLEHIMTQHMNVKKCCYCFKTFADGKGYEEHLKFEKERRKSGNVKRICDICGFEASCRSALNGHKQRRHPIEEFICDLCGKTCINRTAYNFHFRMHHEDKTIVCTECGKKFARQGDLNVHVNAVHKKKYARTCDECGKVFRLSYHLVKHKETVHSNICKYECKKCGRGFKSSSVLIKHQFSHLQKRPFNCHLCAQGYYMTDYLKSHYLKVHGLTYSSEEVREVCVRVHIDKELL